MSQIDEQQMLSMGTVLDHRYRIVRYLASGGFGNTYVAEDTRLGGQVAVKEFFMRSTNHRSTDGTTVEVSNDTNAPVFQTQLKKFQREARRIFELRNDHIIQVIDLFDANGTSYYVMKLINGSSLAKQTLPEQEALDVILQVLDALEAMHKAGLYHLDVKPGNIMREANGHCTLIDFGASKQLTTDERNTLSSSSMAYTPGYAPLEQMAQQSQDIGPWTDFFALGATLYCLVTGTPPPQVSVTDFAPNGRQFPYPATVSATIRHAVSALMNPIHTLRPQTAAEVRTLLGGTYRPKEPPKPKKTLQPEETVLDHPSPIPTDEEIRFTSPTRQTPRHQGLWYAVAGIAAGILLLGFFVLQKACDSKGSMNPELEVKPQLEAKPQLNDSIYRYEGNWNSPKHGAQPCRMEFEKKGNTLSNCKYTNLLYNVTVPLEGTIDGDTLRFSNVSNKYNLRINLAMPTVFDGNLVGYGIDHKHSDLRATLNLHAVAQRTSEVNSQEQDRQARYNAYVAKLNEYAKRVRNEDRFEASYFLHDMTGDGNPELCVFAGVTSPMDFPGDEFSIYFYTFSQGEIKFIGKYDDGSAGMADSDYYKGNGYILNVCDMQLFKISYYNGDITYTLENSDYSDTPTERKIIFLELSDRSALSQISG